MDLCPVMPSTISRAMRQVRSAAVLTLRRPNRVSESFPLL